MERGRKRQEGDGLLPADKRPCSSSGGGGGGGSSSSSSSEARAASSSSERPLSDDHDMDRSNDDEEEEEDDQGGGDYGYSDEEGPCAEARRADERCKFGRILPVIQDDSRDAGEKLAALVELCEVLSLTMEDSLSSFPMGTAVPALVRLAGTEGSPDIMLLAVRALTYLCDVAPRSVDVVVKHGALPMLCSRLMAIEYLDLAEQCLQALDKISRRQPVPCLQAGSVMAALGYIDFFSTSIQRVALSIIVNICKKLSVENAPLVMEAIPILCNVLMYDNPKLVESSATCIIRITECFSQSPVLLDELCNHSLINQVLQLIAVDSRVTLNQSTYKGLLGLLTKLAASSPVAVRTLFELNIGSTLKTILMASAELPYSASHHIWEISQSNQVHEILKLVHQLIPPVTKDHQDLDLVRSKEKILVEQPEFLMRFSRDMLLVFVQVANRGASSLSCYGCISAMHGIFHLCTPDMLLDFVRNMNISSFLAGLLMRKNRHTQMLALKVVDILMQKLRDVFLCTFLKEGVIYAIECLLTPEKCSVSIDQNPSHSQVLEYQGATSDTPKCFCHVYYFSKSSPSEAQVCMLENDSVFVLAKHLKSVHFLVSMDEGVSSTRLLEKLKSYCAALDDNVDKPLTTVFSDPDECPLADILNQIMQELVGVETLSTFEFVQSGIVRSLLHYLLNGSPKSNRVDYKRCELFSDVMLSRIGEDWKDKLMSSLVSKFQNALSSFDSFPLILSQPFKSRNVYSDIPAKRTTLFPCIRVRFVKEDCDTKLLDYGNVSTVELSSSMGSIEEFLWHKVSPMNQDSQNEDLSKTRADFLINNGVEHHGQQNSDLSEGVADQGGKILDAALNVVPNRDETGLSGASSTSSRVDEVAQNKLIFSLAGKDIDGSCNIYQAILQARMQEDMDLIIRPRFWSEVHEVKYRLSGEQSMRSLQMSCDTFDVPARHEINYFWQKIPFLSDLMLSKLPCQHDSLNPSTELLLMLIILEGINKYSFHILTHKRINAFADGEIQSFDDLKVTVSKIPQIEFINWKLTDKLLQQIRDPLATMTCCMPLWCSQLMGACPFLFSFEARWKYFLLITGYSTVMLEQARHLMGDPSPNDRHPPSPAQRKKFKVSRDCILQSASKMLTSHARSKFPLEVEYIEEVGTGLGPTMEFYTLVSHEFQKVGLGMWRDDQTLQVRSDSGKEASTSGFVVAPHGLFPRPWHASELPSSGTQFASVLKNFKLLGQLVAKAIKDGRILDLQFSRAFYKLILEQELSIYDIPSFDAGLGWTMLEFQALVCRKTKSESSSSVCCDLSYRNVRVEDLSLDITLPGYPDFVLSDDLSTVNVDNLEIYISSVVDATIGSGISRQLEAFKSGFNEVFPLKTLQIFTEDELDQLLCGERDAWEFSELLDHINFDHGYTANSPPVINLLEIIQEYNADQRRAFVQFVTGAPRLPLGGLAALNPKMTIVRKHCNDEADMGLPSVMTCVNYLKLPPYPSKELMRERLSYAITEGQGSFHLS